MKSNDTEVARLFLEAERKGMCLATPSRRVCDVLRRRIERGEAVKPARGMYARAPYWDSLSKPQRMLHVMRTLQSLHPDWTFCRESAAVAFGLPVSYREMDVVHVATTRGNRNANSKDVRWHVVDDDEFSVVRGFRVTPLTRTVFDCMRATGFPQALAIADGALRVSGMSSSSFACHFERTGGNCTGKAHAIRTMRYADARSESGGESIARAVMIREGFALPELQVALPQPMNPQRSFRIDFLWTRLDGSRVLGEFDGMRKYEDEAMLGGRSSLRALADERHREAQLTLYGMSIVRFTYQDVTNAGRFVELLDRYGIPRSEEAARIERRLTRARSTSAHIFTVCPLSDEPFLQPIRNRRPKRSVFAP